MQIYLVGGAVRDFVLGLPPHDKDYVVVGSTPQEMLSLGFVQVGKDFPVFLHPQTKEEYALARREIAIGKGHKDFAFEFAPDITLEDDLIRRDFTCNAMAYDEKTQQIIDPFDGMTDIKNRLLRHISPHFAEDPLRVLRACRFAAQLDFSIAPKTLQLCQKISASGALATLSAERIWQEISKALNTPRFEVFISSLADCGALTCLMPEIKSIPQVLSSAHQNSPHIKWAALLYPLSSVERQNIHHRLKTPNVYADFAHLCAANLQSFIRLSSTDCTSLFELTCAASSQFKNLDTLKDFLSFCGLFCPQPDYARNAQLCLSAFELLKDVKAPLMPEFTSLSGAELGQAYRAYRIKLLQDYFKS